MPYKDRQRECNIKYLRKRYQNLKSLGTCTNCCHRPAAEGRTKCSICLEKKRVDYLEKREHYKRLRKKRYLTQRNSSKEYKPRRLYRDPLSFNSDVAYVLGALWGDGYLRLQKRNYSAQFAVKDIEFIESFQKSIQRLTGLLIPIKKHDGMYYLWVCSKKWVIFLKDCYSRLGEIGRVEKIAFVRGFFDAEGCISGHQISIANSNIDKLLTVKEFLSDLGYHPHINRGDIYYLRLSRKNEILRFGHNIQPTIGRKREKMEVFRHG